MTALDQLVPVPRLLEVDHVDLAAPPERVWELVRHGDLAGSPLVRALFALRTLPERIAGHGAPGDVAGLRLDDLVSTPERPGFQVLVETPSREVAVGAIGKVWLAEIPFVHVPSAARFALFDEPGFARVAWSLRVEPRGTRDTRLSVEVRVDTTDEASWERFRAYFRWIGPASRFIRHSLLASLERDFGSPDAHENLRALPGDELLPDAREQLTHCVDIAATPSAIWPWLVQMGGRRAGYYSIDALDNQGVRSATEIDPALQDLEVGDVLRGTPDANDGFEVLRIEPARALILGGLHDPQRGEQRAFTAARPERFWHVTWAFVLEPLDASTTRLHVRARAAFSPDERLHAAWILPVHELMESAQLRNLAARIEGRRPRDDVRDVLEGIGGAAVMTAALLTPFLRDARTHWGIDQAAATRVYPGDGVVEAPRWGWTHGIEIDATPDEVWPWIAQIGADRGGFYSYQWLENLGGCGLKNAETVHPEWELREGDGLRLHPKMPPLRVESVERGRWFLAVARADAEAREKARSWVSVSWLFFLEPIGERRTRFVSRYRIACSDDLVTRISYGPALVEPIGFAMDRRMLLGVKERVDRAGRARQAVRHLPAM